MPKTLASSQGVSPPPVQPRHAASTSDLHQAHGTFKMTCTIIGITINITIIKLIILTPTFFTVTMDSLLCFGSIGRMEGKMETTLQDTEGGVECSKKPGYWWAGNC